MNVSIIDSVHGGGGGGFGQDHVQTQIAKSTVRKISHRELIIIYIPAQNTTLCSFES